MDLSDPHWVDTPENRRERAISAAKSRVYIEKKISLVDPPMPLFADCQGREWEVVAVSPITTEEDLVLLYDGDTCALAAAPDVKIVTPYQRYQRQVNQHRDAWGRTIFTVLLTVAALHALFKKDTPPPDPPRHPEMKAVQPKNK